MRLNAKAVCLRDFEAGIAGNPAYAGWLLQDRVLAFPFAIARNFPEMPGTTEKNSDFFATISARSGSIGVQIGGRRRANQSPTRHSKTRATLRPRFD
jgi:hypothetical protein